MMIFHDFCVTVAAPILLLRSSLQSELLCETKVSVVANRAKHIARSEKQNKFCSSLVFSKSKINFALLSFFRNFAKDFRKSFYK